MAAVSYYIYVANITVHIFWAVYGGEISESLNKQVPCIGLLQATRNDFKCGGH